MRITFACVVALGAVLFLGARASRVEAASVSTELSTVEVAPAEIFANNLQMAVITVQAKNAVGSILPGLPVAVSVNTAGLVITPSATSTDIAGKAIFEVRAYMPGNKEILTTVSGQLLQPIYLNVIGFPTIGSGTSSAGVPSSLLSSLETSPVTVGAGGQRSVTVTVTVKDLRGAVLQGKIVTPRANIAGVTFSPTMGITGGDGVSMFTAVTTSTEDVVFSAVVENVGITGSAVPLSGSTVSTNSAGSTGVVGTSTSPYIGQLIKLNRDDTPEATTVYYVSADGLRHPFPNEAVFRSWYANFSQVQLISAAQLAVFPLGSNVTLRPGSLMKFPSDPRVYVVSRPHSIRWITSEDVAKQYFGLDWASRVTDQSEALFLSYAQGLFVTKTNGFSFAQETDASSIQGAL